jgi:hypothetical protein
MLYKEFNGMTENIMSELLDIYQMKDWGCSWAQFLEIFNEVVDEKIGKWQKEKIGEEE